MKPYVVSRATENDSTNLVVLATSPRNAFYRYRQIAEMPKHLVCEDIGEPDNPCIRYLASGGARFYVQPYSASRAAKDCKTCGGNGQLGPPLVQGWSICWDCQIEV
jgi:hypothetical protein